MAAIYIILLLLLSGTVHTAPTENKAYFSCYQQPQNKVKLHFYLKLIPWRGKVEIHAVDAQNMTLDTCAYTGDGRDPLFQVHSTVSVDDGTEDNPCGMVVVEKPLNVTVYQWRFRPLQTSFDGMEWWYGDPTYWMECNPETIMPNTVVSGPIKVLPNPNNEVLLAPSIESILMHVVRSGAVVSSLVINDLFNLRVTFRPDPYMEDHIHAWGVYMYDCIVSPYVSLSDALDLIDGSGCGQSSNRFKPTHAFKMISSTDDYPFVSETGYFRMVGHGNAKRLYFACKVNFCYYKGDPNCVKRCARDSRRRREVREIDDKYVVVASVTIRQEDITVSDTDTQKRLMQIVIGGLVTIVCIFLIVVITVFFCLRSRRRRANKAKKRDSERRRRRRRHSKRVSRVSSIASTVTEHSNARSVRRY